MAESICGNGGCGNQCRLSLRMGAQAGDHELIRAFSRYQEQRNLRPRTIEARRSALRSFAAFNPGLLGANWRDVERWLSRPLLPSSRADYLSYLHNFYAWAIREELTEADPTVKIPSPRVPRHLPRPIGEDALVRAFRSADPRMLAMLALAAYAGLRCMDIANLAVEDVVWTAYPLLMIRGSKGDKDRVLPLCQKVELALKAYGVPSYGPVFARKDGGHFTAGTISRYINAHLRACGLGETAHQLRHRFGSRLYSVSKDIVLTQEMMGHASIATTRGYVAFCPDEAAKAIEAL